MVRPLDKLLVLVLEFLFKPNQDNKDFWEKVKLDIDHPCYFSLTQSRHCTDKNNRLILFRKELKQALLYRLRGEKLTKCLAQAIILSDEHKIRADLCSLQSNILQTLVDILKICITVYGNHSRVHNFSACSQLYRQSTPLIIQWSRTENSFIEAASPQYHKQYSHSLETNNSYVKNNDSGSINIKAKNYRKHKQRSHKSTEVISSSDSSDLDDNLSNSSYVKQDKKIVLDKSNQGYCDSDSPKEGKIEGMKLNHEHLDTDSSMLRDLSCSDSDVDEPRQKVKKISEHKDSEIDFIAELHKLEDSQLDMKSSSSSLKTSHSTFGKIKEKKDPIIKVSELGKNLQEFPPFSDLYQDSLNKVEANISTFLEITERLKKHALVLQNNLLPGNIENCLCCPTHCAQALVKATKDKRGPKKKKT